MKKVSSQWSVVLGCLMALPALADSQRGDEFGKTPTLKTPTPPQVRGDVAKWLDEINAQEPVRQQALALWPEDLQPQSGPDLLKRLADTFSVADADAKALVELCTGPSQSLMLPEFAWLIDEARPAFLRHNLRLLLGRWLAQQELHEEAVVQLEGLQPQQVVDPASLLFYQSVAYHRLVQKEAAMKSIRRLLDDVEDQPQRYVAVAGLMYEDLKGLKEESLDHISRQMDDVKRRLDLGRTGPKVRKVEDDVVAALDKLIEELEKQQQQQQSGSGGQQLQPSMPASDSRIMGGRGPGEVDRKAIGSKSGWGDLPPKQREEAMQQIGKDFPSHYREVIEQYFRKLAGEEKQ
jgi:hypothetical protein